ncbi:hypothetical protein HY008_00520, partial [Candidatus Woesebacteria bacterium]|nr:hypothetical protein [Candidatus Woesebacteria bacterium]
MKKMIYILVGIVIFLVVAGFITKAIIEKVTRDITEREIKRITGGEVDRITQSEKEIQTPSPAINELDPLCSRDACPEFCIDNPFPCEAYCVQRPQNKYCQRHFSFVYDINSSIGHPLMRVPEFRQYNYTFTNGTLVQKPPKIEHIGIEIDFYNKQTNKAG